MCAYFLIDLKLRFPEYSNCRSLILDWLIKYSAQWHSYCVLARVSLNFQNEMQMNRNRSIVISKLFQANSNFKLSQCTNVINKHKYWSGLPKTIWQMLKSHETIATRQISLKIQKTLKKEIPTYNFGGFCESFQWYCSGVLLSNSMWTF